MIKQDISSEAVKSVPAVAVAGGGVVGAFTINEWLAAATIVYVVLQAAYLIWKWRKESKK